MKMDTEINVHELCSPTFDCMRLVQCEILHNCLILHNCNPFRPCIRLLEPCGPIFFNPPCPPKFWIAIDDSLAACGSGFLKACPGFTKVPPSCVHDPYFDPSQFDPEVLVTRINELEVKVKALELKRK